MSHFTQVLAHVLPQLSRSEPSWAVLKNHETLPVVTGDVDLCLPRKRWNDFTGRLREAFSHHGEYWSFFCDHYQGVRLLFIGTVSEVLEVDLADGIWWKGTQMLSAERVLEKAVMDNRGFNRTGSGLEAAYHLTVAGVGRFGDLDLDLIKEKGVRNMAKFGRDDFVWAMEAMHGNQGKRAAEAFLHDDWNPRMGRALVMKRVVSNPLVSMFQRTRLLAVRKLTRHWRSLPRTIEQPLRDWLDRVARGHRLEGSQVALSAHRARGQRYV